MKKSMMLIATVVALTAPAIASALTVIGDETRVELTAAGALGALGVSVQPVGIGAIDAAGPTAIFPITGGSVDDVTGDALIEHDGSGLTLSVGTDSLLLLNFLIDTAQTTIFGDAVVIDDDGGMITAAALNDIDIFSFDAGLNVFLTDTAAGALNGLFGTAFAAGDKIGEASLDLATVPVPAALWLLAPAAGVLVTLRRG